MKGRELWLRLDQGHDRLGTNTVELHRLRRPVGLQSRLEGGEVWDLEDQPTRFEPDGSRKVRTVIPAVLRVPPASADAAQ